MKMEKTNKILIAVIVVLALLLTYLITRPEEVTGYYDLLCENASNLKEYTHCINLENKLNN